MEIGVQVKEKIFWKMYGALGLEAVVDETGHGVLLHYDLLRRLMAISDGDEVYLLSEHPSVYGPLVKGSIPHDLLEYAKSFSWQGLRSDPTGLLWMGARYYDPKRGAFLSTDPIAYPIALDLYSYANGDPVNFVDFDGRFSSRAYQWIEPTVLGFGSAISAAWNHPITQGSMQVAGGVGEIAAGGVIALGTAAMAAPLGGIVVAHGADHVATGFTRIFSGKESSTMTSRALQMTGMSPALAEGIDAGLWVLGIAGGARTVLFATKGSQALLNKPSLVPTKISLNFTETAGKHMLENGRKVPIHTLHDVIKFPKAMLKDPQGSSNATMYYSHLWKNQKLYNIEVLYDEASNTVSHFRYARDPLGPLPLIPKPKK